ncbi:putative MFS family arabinose efflux permease [Catenulispora sp. EB89]|uniref:MFS transporter n=1 Tax=Catenulispora sp. EB89 TaxID=3156257 RepID=UPI003514D90F
MRPQRLSAVPIQPDQDFRAQTGPLDCHKIGPYHRGNSRSTVRNMSTQLSTAPDRNTDVNALQPRIMSRPLVLVFLSQFCTLSSFFLLLSVTPLFATAAGAGSAGAGLVNGALLAGTVAAELVSSAVMRHCANRTVLAVGAVLMGLPTLALHSGSALGVIIAVSSVRGFGFGLSTVVAGAMAAELVPPERRGEGFGLFGMVATVPAVVALPLGLWFAGHVGSSVVIVATAVTGFVPLAVFPWLSDATGLRQRRQRRQQQRSTSSGPRRRTGSGQQTLSDILRQRTQLRLGLIFAASTIGAGVVVSFLPLAAGISKNLAAAGLLAQALTAAVGRWWAGRSGDRKGHARLLAPALAISSSAMAALLWPASPIAVIAGMSAFGAGFGIIQNATFALLIEGAPAGDAGAASALWNLAYDVGYGAGPAVFGLVVSHTGYPAAFVMTGALMLAAVPAAGSRLRHIR